MSTPQKNRIIKIIIWTVSAIILISALLVAAVFFWPATSKQLQSSNSEKLNYNQSVTAAIRTINGDSSNTDVRPECRSIIKTHSQKTAKAVLMIHGVSACPQQFAELGDTFFKAGYNVYIPRVPSHGLTDNKRHGEITIPAMAQFMNSSTSIISGLGEETGVIGLSGGANMATWIAQYNSATISRALLLSPFYQPSTSEMPAWQSPLLRNLYGRNILPDSFSAGSNLSYRALGKYMIIAKNYKSDFKATGLKHIGVVTSENDTSIDMNLAANIPKQIATASNAKFQSYSIPASFGIGHDIVALSQDEVKKYANKLYPFYLDTYEGKDVKLESK